MNNSKRTCIRHFAGLVMMLIIVGPALAQSTTSLEGAWKVTERWGQNSEGGEWRAENVQPSVYLFIDGYYSIASVNGDEPRPLLPDDASRSSLTPEQASAVWRSYTSNSGTYEVSGTTITTTPIVALWSNFMAGGSAAYEYRFEDDALILHSSGDDWSWNVKLGRY